MQKVLPQNHVIQYSPRPSSSEVSWSCRPQSYLEPEDEPPTAVQEVKSIALHQEQPGVEPEGDVHMASLPHSHESNDTPMDVDVVVDARADEKNRENRDLAEASEMTIGTSTSMEEEEEEEVREASNSSAHNNDDHAPPAGAPDHLDGVADVPSKNSEDKPSIEIMAACVYPRKTSTVTVQLTQLEHKNDLNGDQIWREVTLTPNSTTTMATTSSRTPPTQNENSIENQARQEGGLAQEQEAEQKPSLPLQDDLETDEDSVQLRKRPVPTPRRSLSNMDSSDISKSSASKKSSVSSMAEEFEKTATPNPSLASAFDAHVPLSGRSSVPPPTTFNHHDNHHHNSKKLSFASPAIMKKADNSKSQSKAKKLSTFSLHNTTSEADDEVDEIQPLQRRNSIHNVPYVDVNDPGTRERMERYKEERRSMLRAKYKVEDYISADRKTSVSSTKSVSGSEEKPSPDMNRFRKFSKSTTSEERDILKPNTNGETPPATEVVKKPATATSTRPQNKTRKFSEPVKSTQKKDEVGVVGKKHSLQQRKISRESPPKTLTGNGSGPKTGNTRLCELPRESGLIEEDVNVKERAAMFGPRAKSWNHPTPKIKPVPTPTGAHKKSHEKANSLRPKSDGSVESRNNRNSSSNAKMRKDTPGSPSKIRDMAAMFEQKN